MKLRSDSFRNGAAMPAPHALTAGGNRHPHLHWSDTPGGTQSLALVGMLGDAPDADFFLWSVVDLPPALMALPAGALPEAPETLMGGVRLRQGLNGYRRYGYHAPLPAQNATRHYIFRIYALDTPRLGLPPQFTGADVLDAIYGHIIDEAQLIVAHT